MILIDRKKITLSLLFSNDSVRKTEEAIKFYSEVFDDSEIGLISRYGNGEAQSSKAQIIYVSFKHNGAHFSAMDNAYDVDYNFNEAFHSL